MSHQATVMRSQAHGLYRQGDIHDAVDMFVAAWAVLPEPREAQPPASAIAAELANISLNDLGDLDVASYWTERLARCAGPHGTPREVELLRGRIELARGDIHAASRHLAAGLGSVTAGMR
jgi:uncharacterized protein HemY